MAIDLLDVLPFVLPHEGGTSNDPDDPGGYTKWGVSLRYLRSIGDRDHDGVNDGDFNLDGVVDWRDVRDMTPAQSVIAYEGIWQPGGAWRLESRSIAAKVFDNQVHRGIVNGARNLQAAIAYVHGKVVVEVDGRLGPATAAAANELREPALMRSLCIVCRVDYLDLMARIPRFRKYVGWISRAADVPAWEVKP